MTKKNIGYKIKNSNSNSCEKCKVLNDKIVKTQSEVDELIPVHPNCNCYAAAVYEDKITEDELFAKNLNILFELEGGYNNRKSDRGGETNFGVTKKWYPDKYKEIKSITKQEAKDYYKKEYWNTRGINKLPNNISYSVFDSATNQGQGTAVMMLQEVVGEKQDGIIGNKTLSAIENYKGDLFNNYLNRRKKNYDEIIKNDKIGDQKNNYNGWINRLKEIKKKRDLGII